MNKILINTICAGCGCLIGVCASYLYFNKQIEKEIEKEVTSYKNIMNKLQDQIYSLTKTENVDSDTTKENIKRRNSQDDSTKSIADYILKQENYSQYSQNPEKVQFLKRERAPYVISPEEYAEIDGEDYTIVTLSYYEDDGVLTYDNGEVVEDIDSTIGCDSLKTFGQYERDCIYVINEDLQEAIEVLLIAGSCPYVV